MLIRNLTRLEDWIEDGDICDKNELFIQIFKVLAEKIITKIIKMVPIIGQKSVYGAEVNSRSRRANWIEVRFSSDGSHFCFTLSGRPFNSYSIEGITDETRKVAELIIGKKTKPNRLESQLKGRFIVNWGNKAGMENWEIKHLNDVLSSLKCAYKSKPIVYTGGGL